MKSFLKSLFPSSIATKLRHFYWNSFDWVAYKSFSGEGEDMILRKLFFYQKTGFYVDIGAYHPKKSSNTYHFYKKGWRGINIDAMPGSMTQFNKFRKRDINLEIPIGEDGKQLNFYVFQDHALNGFETERIKAKDQNKVQNKIEQIIPMRSASLTSILDMYLPEGQEIDFLDIDVEGSELSILQGLNFFKYRPKVILVEILDFDLTESSSNQVYSYLIEKDYKLKAKTINSCFFISSKNKKELVVTTK